MTIALCAGAQSADKTNKTSKSRDNERYDACIDAECSQISYKTISHNPETYRTPPCKSTLWL